MNHYLEAMSGYVADEAKGVYGDFILRSNLGRKKIKVIDGVVGSHDAILRLAVKNTLQPGIILTGVTSKGVSQ